MDDITTAQVEAGEAAVVERLRQRGLLPSENVVDRLSLEHSLATTFVKWTKERDPAERTRLWGEMFDLAKKLEQLND